MHFLGPTSLLNPAAALVSLLLMIARRRIHGEPARILFVHVGKTGGLSLEIGVPFSLRVERNALQCLMNRTNHGGERRRKLSLEEEWTHGFEAPNVENNRSRLT